MADQPQPDYSQSPQYSPGFQPQVPIPGITSSYQSQPYQSPFQQPYYQGGSQYVMQQADSMAFSSANSSKITMAIAQQNLMYSMHNAMLGTLGAFSDVSRRGSSMITAMSPAGRYNDFLAPNQNWALESSFRREVGYNVMKGFGLDPYDSPLSRLVQGRRPEFLTEGEYGSTMNIASKLRGEQFEKGFLSVAAGFGASGLVSALGMGLAPAIAIPMGIGLVADRMLEAKYAESEDLLKNQMYVKNKRMGIGQQYINTREMGKIHKTFYEEDNPYASRFFGDNFLGNAFKPDVEKLKVFHNAADNGLLSF